MSAFWLSPWSRVVAFLLGALAWRAYLRVNAWWTERQKTKAQKEENARKATPIREPYRSAEKEDPEAPLPAEKGFLSDDPTAHEVWVIDLLKSCITEYALYKPNGFQLSRNGRLFSVTYNTQLELFVYKTDGHKPITSSNLVTFLRRVRAFDNETFTTKPRA